MGQYYKPTIINKNGLPVIHANPWDFKAGDKLTEQANYACLSPKFISAVLSYIAKHPNSRLVWAGDYADGTIDMDGEKNINIYQANTDMEVKQFPTPKEDGLPQYKYVINSTKKEYYDAENDKSEFFPLALLTADGNGLGGGDYFGSHMELVGHWKGDKIALSNDKPAGDDYKEIHTNFYE